MAQKILSQISTTPIDYCINNPCSECLRHEKCDKIDDIFYLLDLIDELGSARFRRKKHTIKTKIDNLLKQLGGNQK